MKHYEYLALCKAHIFQVDRCLWQFHIKEGQVVSSIFWTRWGAVALGVFSRTSVGAWRLFSLHA